MNAFHLPLNSTSLGQVSLSILRELFSRGEDITLFPIGPVDLGTQSSDPEFFGWVQSALNKSPIMHNRKTPVFKLWHLNGSLESVSEKQVLQSFYEVDSPTPTELNIVKNNSSVLLSSSYAVSKFSELGCANVKYIPLAFDATHFKTVARSKTEGIQYSLLGKLEPQRKRHLKVLQNWIKLYGNKKGYNLNCAIHNQFLDPEQQKQMILHAMGGQKYWNVNFLNYMGSNETYNQLLNNTDIVLAMSGGEGWGLPEFQTTALGKHCVGLNAHAYQGWMTPENSVLVQPSGKIPCYDNMFFKEGQPFNQGRIFDWSDEDFQKGLVEVEARFRANPVNTAGLELQEKFSYKKMVDNILDIMNQTK
jgi:hypothetical protein